MLVALVVLMAFTAMRQTVTTETTGKLPVWAVSTWAENAAWQRSVEENTKGMMTLTRFPGGEGLCQAGSFPQFAVDGELEPEAVLEQGGYVKITSPGQSVTVVTTYVPSYALRVDVFQRGWKSTSLRESRERPGPGMVPGQIPTVWSATVPGGFTAVRVVATKHTIGVKEIKIK